MKDLQGFTAAVNFNSVSRLRMDLTEVACKEMRNSLIFLYLMRMVAPVHLSEAAVGVALNT